MKLLTGFLEKNKVAVLAVLLGIVIVVSIYILFGKKLTKEGFYPVTQARIDLEDNARHRYNLYADTQDQLNMEGVIPMGEKGNKMLNDATGTKVYEASGRNVDVGPGMVLRNDDSANISPLPDNAELRRRIKLCQSVKSWDCRAFNNPEFQQYCGICVESKGTDAQGKPFDFGGLYIDPDLKGQLENDARAQGKQPEYIPSVGKCPSNKFILGRPNCDYRKDRWECANAKILDDEYAKEKCLLCLNPPTGQPTFIYSGTRNSADTEWSLNKKIYKFPLILRLVVSEDKGKIKLTRTSSGAEIVPKRVQTLQYEYLIPDALENESFSLYVEYESYMPYNFTASEVAQINSMITENAALNPPLTSSTITVVSASYGRNCNSALAGNRTDLIAKQCNGEETCAFKYDYSKTGGDPAGGCGKTLEIKYTCAGSDKVLSFMAPAEAGFNANVKLDCGGPQATAALAAAAKIASDKFAVLAQSTVCQLDETHVWTNGAKDNLTLAYGCGGSQCCVSKPITSETHYGIVAQFESSINPRRQFAFDTSIQRINGLAVDAEVGPTRYGSIKSTSVFTNVPGSQTLGLAQNRFWVWDKDVTKTKGEFVFVVPVTFMEPTFPQDAGICPVGPLVQTQLAADRLRAGPCYKLVNGQEQGPGTYTADCIRSLFIEGGCSNLGEGYPKDKFKLDALSMDSDGTTPLDKEGMIDKVNMRKAAADKFYQAGDDVKKLTEANMYCYGKFQFNPCETPNKQFGPQSVECLDFLFTNAGKRVDKLGPTYGLSSNRSSGTDRNKQNPVMYCQRTGLLSPVSATGVPNLESINKANSLGSVSNIKNYYDEIHKTANFGVDVKEQKRAMNDCYGVRINKNTLPKVSCGGNVRYVKITHSRNDWLQVSEIIVKNEKGRNVAQNKPVTASVSWANMCNPRNIVQGRAQMKNWNEGWHAGSGNWEGPARAPFMLIDLQSDEDVREVQYWNRNDCCRERSVGIVITLLDKQKQELVSRKLTTAGQPSETVKFESVGGDVKPSIIPNGTVFTLKPGVSPGARVINLMGDIVIQANLRKEQEAMAQFAAKVVGEDTIQIVTLSGPPKDGYLVVNGYKVSARQDDDSDEFKASASWKVVDSVADAPGEISFESVSNPGFFMAINTLSRSVNIDVPKDYDTKKRMSFALL